MFNNQIIVIGASAGGLEAVTKLLSKLPADFPAAVFIVMHIPLHNVSYLPAILSRASKLPAIHPTENQKIQSGQIYVAPPNQHMLINNKGNISLQHGPKVNHCRPAIDPLFRSAAIAYGPKVIGVLLSGMLDDGSAGLLAIKRRGGLIITQDPEEAQFPDMPRNALAHLPIDHCLPVVDIAMLLITLVNQPSLNDDPPSTITSLMELEANMNLTTNDIPQDDMDKLGNPSVFTCPECHGTLWEIEDESLLRFRCRVGHAYGLESLSASINENVEEALWAAMRVLEEKANLAKRVAERSARDNQENISLFNQKAQLAKQHAQVIREILLSDDKGPE